MLKPLSFLDLFQKITKSVLNFLNDFNRTFLAYGGESHLAR